MKNTFKKILRLKKKTLFFKSQNMSKHIDISTLMATHPFTLALSKPDLPFPPDTLLGRQGGDLEVHKEMGSNHI